MSSCVAQVRCSLAAGYAYALALALRQPFGALWCSGAGRRERLSADKRLGARIAVGMLTMIMSAPAVATLMGIGFVYQLKSMKKALTMTIVVITFGYGSFF